MIAGIIVLFVLNFTDWLSTVLLGNQAIEGNPIVVCITQQGFLISFIFKMIVTFLVSCLLSFAYRKGPKKYPQIGLVILNLFYGVVVCNNLFLLASIKGIF